MFVSKAKRMAKYLIGGSSCASLPTGNASKPHISAIRVTKKTIRGILKKLRKKKKTKKNTNTKKGRKLPTPFTCEICTNSKPSWKIFKNKGRCVHLLCKDCIVKYIEAKVDDNITDIKCPWLSCNQQLNPLTCRKIIPTGLFVKWCDLLCDSALLGFERCYCPNEECLALVVNECDETVKKSECPKCKELFCFQCKVAWSDCNDTGVEKENDKLFVELAREKKWIRCPRCSYYVARISGCSHVRCRCGMNFCYRCGNMLCNCD